MVGDETGREIQPHVVDVDRYEDERDLTAIVGRYFTSVEDVVQRIETSSRNGEQVQYAARRPVAAGTTLLVAKMRFLDDVLHSVEMLAHPADPDQSRLPFMADEFFTFFVPAEEGVRRRERDDLQAEIDAAMARIGSTQSQIAIAAPTQERPADKALVVAASSRQGLADRMRAMVAQAEQRRGLVEAESAAVSRMLGVFERFTKEIAVSALGMVSDQIEFATSVTVGLKTLSFFTGEGVEVVELRTGASASMEEPLTLYQSLLYLDEELAVNLLDQGFDHRQMEDLPDILADRTLVDRMIPAARGAVLVRVRREDATYIPTTTLGSMMANAMLNMENHVSYLLVKDGENLHLVHSEVTSDETRHLFPARREIDDIFRMQGREVLPEHLEYSTAKDNFEKRTVFYRRLVLMMWGLDERLGLFGDFHSQGDYDGWFDDRFHMERMVYVHDAENVVEHARPSFSQWADEKNRHVQLGSLLAVDWRAFIDPESLPEAFETTRNGHYRQLLFPVDRQSIVKVEKKGDCLVVRTKVEPLYGGKKPKTVHVLVAEGLGPHSGLCLDMVDRPELQYYLNSRRERRAYATFLSTFRMVDDHLRDEERTQAKTLTDLHSRMEFAGLPQDIAAAALRKAVVLWRAQNGGTLIGGRGWKPNMANLLLDMAFAIAGRRDDLFERARQDLPGVRPLELRIDGRGDLVLYRELREGEGFAGIGLFDGKWVGRTRLRVERDGRVCETDAPEASYLHNPDFDRRIYREDSRVFRRFDREIALVSDAEACAAWLVHEPDWLMPEDARRMAEAAAHDGEAALAALTPSVVRSRLHARFHQSYKKDRQPNVDVGRVTMPLAVVRTDDRYGLLQLAAVGTDFYASFGPAMAAEALKIVDYRFKYPESKVKRIRYVTEHFSPDRLPFAFEIVWKKLDELRPGLSFLTAQDANGSDVPIFHRGDTPFGSLHEAVREDARNMTRNKETDVQIRFANEANRRVAERYFMIATNTDGSR